MHHQNQYCMHVPSPLFLLWASAIFLPHWFHELLFECKLCHHTILHTLSRKCHALYLLHLWVISSWFPSPSIFATAHYRTVFCPEAGRENLPIFSTSNVQRWDPLFQKVCFWNHYRRCLTRHSKLFCHLIYHFLNLYPFRLHR